MKFHEQDYREIITKAVCGKGRKCLEETKHVKPMHNPCSILGCWVINHKYSAVQEDDSTVCVEGSYDINVWYSYNDNKKTEVVTETVKYTESIKVVMRDENCLDEDQEVIVKTIKQPSCVDCTISEDGQCIHADVELELYVELIGETKLKVKVNPGFKDEDGFDDYWKYEVTDDELKEVDWHFLQKKK